MAYRRTARRSFAPARRRGGGYGNRRVSRVNGGMRRGTRRASPSTVRIVIEQPAANPIARPEYAAVVEKADKKAKF